MRTPPARVPALECAAGNTSETTAAASRKQKEEIGQLGQWLPRVHDTVCLVTTHSSYLGLSFYFAMVFLKKNVLG